MTDSKIKIVKPDMIQTDLLMMQCAQYAHQTDLEGLQLLTLSQVLKDVARQEDYYGVVVGYTDTNTYMPFIEALETLRIKVHQKERAGADTDIVDIIADMQDCKNIMMTDIITVLFAHFDTLHNEPLYWRMITAIRGWNDDIIADMEGLKIEAMSETMELETPIDDDGK